MILFLVTVTLMTSCSPILKTIYGIKNPKFTDTETAQKYLDKKGIKGNDVYFKSVTDLVKATNNDFKIPAAVFFNRNGEQIEFRTSVEECVNDITVFLNNIEQIDEMPVKSGLSLNQLVQHISDGNENPIVIDKGADAIVFINWSTYMGRLNKSVFEWTNIIQKIPNTNSELKVDYYLLSFDLLEKWEDKHLIEDK